jgi:dihydrofolate reductase
MENQVGRIVVTENASVDGVVRDPTGEEGFKQGGWLGQIKDRPRVARLADRLNSLPKYVVSSTLEDPDRSNSMVLKGDAVSEVSRLKRELHRDIVVLASFRIVHTLMKHDLVDEQRLKVFPVVLGAGERLFCETSDKKAMRLVDSRTIDDGVASLTYDRVRDA